MIIAKIGNGRQITDETKVNKLVKNWTLLSPLCISTDSGLSFTPIMQVDKLNKIAFKSNLNKSKLSICYVVIALITAVLLSLLNQDARMFNISLVFAISLFYLLIEHIFIFSNIETVQKRSFFYIRLTSIYRKSFSKWLSICLAIGATQLLLNFLANGHVPAILRFGGVYSLILDGELWRIASASIFHSGLNHWLTNSAILTIIAGPIFDGLIKKAGLCYFSIGCVIGVLATTICNYTFGRDIDAYTGMSAGIFSLLGSACMKSYISKYNSSGDIYISITNFVIFGVLISSIISPTTSNVSHMFGFLFGASIMFFNCRICSQQISQRK